VRTRFLGVISAAAVFALALLLAIDGFGPGDAPGGSHRRQPVDASDLREPWPSRGETTFPSIVELGRGTPAIAPAEQTPATVAARVVERHARALFRRLDVNGDGRLNQDELTPMLRAELGRWDTNGDGFIDADEFLRYFRSRVERVRATPETVRAAVADGTLPDRRPMVNLAGAGSPPAELPAWFRETDTDNDGQVGLYEWKAAGGSVAAFRRMDRNGDGFLTADEVKAAVARGEATAPSADGPSAPTDRPAASPNRGSPVGVATFVSGSTAKSTAGQAQRSQKSLPHLTPAQLEAQHVLAAVAASRPPSPARIARTIPPPAAPAAVPRLAVAPSSSQPLAATPLAPVGLAPWEELNARNELWLSLGGRANVLFLGDSITYGLENIVGGPVWDTYYAPLGSADFAIPGFTTSEVLWQVEAGQVFEAAPQVVVLMIGINNLGEGQSPPDVATGITRIVQEIQQQLPQTRILLLGVLPSGQSPDYPTRAEAAEVNRRIAGLDDGDRVTFLDIGDWFVEPNGTISATVMPDFLHPSLWGYDLYTSAVWPTMVELLNRQ
jgi:lysophospholipase L1-like esterase/Ca2+-binding EF-hand superfamily protein